MEPTTPPGWYPDVNLGNVERYWDGTGWTPATRTASSEPATPDARSYWSKAGVASRDQHIANTQSSITESVPVKPVTKHAGPRTSPAKQRHDAFWWVMVVGALSFVLAISAAGLHWNTAAQILFIPAFIWICWAVILSSKPVARPEVVCPHCQQRGSVSTRRVTRKQGISGGKATGAIFTGGLSLFATGLSRKQNAQECHCSNCGMTWDIY